MPYKIFNFFINRTKKSERIALKFSSPIASNISNILTTVYSFILSNPLGHQSPYLIYICHLAAHLCGWLSFGIICRSIKSLDKGFNFFGSVIFTLVSILDVAILSPPLQQNTCFPVFILILSSPGPFSISLCNFQILNHLLSLCNYLLF